MRFYELRGPDVWGDVGRVLIGGQASDVCRKDGLLLLDRTGPFVPPIALPLNVVIVTEAFRHEVERAFPGYDFRPVIKDHIVWSDWQTWNRSELPPRRPREGDEPEDFIYSEPHSPEIAETLGGLWELGLSKGAESGSLGARPHAWDWRLKIVESTWNGRDFFWAIPGRFPVVVVSEKAKDWLEATVSDWVSFRESAIA